MLTTHEKAEDPFKRSSPPVKIHVPKGTGGRRKVRLR